MKLATLRDGSRDGHLAVVSRDLASAHYATGIASRLQLLLDDWNFISPQLEDLYATLNGGKARHAFPFDPRLCMAPLPRAYQWAMAGDAGALRHAGSDHLLGPHDPVLAGGDAAPPAGQALLVAASGDLGSGATASQALDSVRLLMLAAAWSPDAAAFAPLAITPDELGIAWRGGQARFSLQTVHNGAAQGAEVISAHLGELLAMLALSRGVRAGSLVGGGCGRPFETVPRPGDTLRIEAVDATGASLFGAIEPRLDGSEIDG